MALLRACCLPLARVASASERLISDDERESGPRRRTAVWSRVLPALIPEYPAPNRAGGPCEGAEPAKLPNAWVDDRRANDASTAFAEGPFKALESRVPLRLVIRCMYEYQGNHERRFIISFLWLDVYMLS